MRSSFMRKKELTIMLGLILLSVSIFNMPINGQNNYSSSFWINSDDAICFQVLEASINGTDGIPINDNNQGPILNSSDYLTFMPQVIPDWNINSSTPMEYLTYIDGYVDTFNVPGAPWSINLLELDGPPAFIPAFPTADSNDYWNNLATALQNQGFNVNINSTGYSIFQYSYSTTDMSISANISMGTGLLLYYHTTFKDTNDNNEVNIITFSIKLDTVFSPEHSIFAWALQQPLLDYNIINAGYLNGTNGLLIEPSNNPGENPVWGQGIIYPGQLMSIEMDSLPNLNGEEEPNYMANFRTDTGKFAFNITLDIPRPNAENNTGFLYPILPLVSDGSLPPTIVDVARSLGSNYTAYYNHTSIFLHYQDHKQTITATWSIKTGILTYYSYTEQPENDYPGMIIEFKLKAYADFQKLDFHWGENAPITHTYKINNAKESNNQSIGIYDENDNFVGYIKPGDILSVKALKFLSFDENGPTANYTITDTTQGWSTNISIMIERPGHIDMENGGPPMLYFHFLVGSPASIDWFLQVMTAAGAQVSSNYTTIQIHWEYYYLGSLGFVLDASWKRDTGVLIHYSVKYHGEVFDKNGEYVEIEMTLTPNNQATPSTSQSSPSQTSPLFLDLPPTLYFLTSIMIILIIRKKYKK